MPTINSERIPWAPRDIQRVSIPAGAKIFELTLEDPENEIDFQLHVRVWFTCDDYTLTKPRKFILQHEGGDVPDDAIYVGKVFFRRISTERWFLFDLGEA